MFIIYHSLLSLLARLAELTSWLCVCLCVNQGGINHTVTCMIVIVILHGIRTCPEHFPRRPTQHFPGLSRRVFSLPVCIPGSWLSQPMGCLCVLAVWWWLLLMRSWLCMMLVGSESVSQSQVSVQPLCCHCFWLTMYVCVCVHTYCMCQAGQYKVARHTVAWNISFCVVLYYYCYYY